MPTPEFRPPAQAVTVSKWDVFRRALLYILVLLVIGNSVIATWTVFLIRQTQVTNTAIGHNTNLTAHQVKQIFTQFEDCITPSGTCAQKNAAATAAIIKQINGSQKRNTILTIVCENTAGVRNNPAAISRCVAHFGNMPGGTSGQGN